jgi:hypothetical protein
MAKQRLGRPPKKALKGEITQIGVRVTGKTKARLLKAMNESGRTISREVEHLIEKAFIYDDFVAAQSVAAQNGTLARLDRNLAELEFLWAS